MSISSWEGSCCKWTAFEAELQQFILGFQWYIIDYWHYRSHILNRRWPIWNRNWTAAHTHTQRQLSGDPLSISPQNWCDWKERPFTDANKCKNWTWSEFFFWHTKVSDSFYCVKMINTTQGQINFIICGNFSRKMIDSVCKGFKKHLARPDRCGTAGTSE